MNLDHFALSHICDNCPERVKFLTNLSCYMLISSQNSIIIQQEYIYIYMGRF